MNLEKLFEVKCIWFEIDPEGQSDDFNLEKKETFYIPGKTLNEVRRICEQNKRNLTNPYNGELSDFFIDSVDEFQASIPGYRVRVIKDKN